MREPSERRAEKEAGVEIVRENGVGAEIGREKEAESENGAETGRGGGVETGEGAERGDGGAGVEDDATGAGATTGGETGVRRGEGIEEGAGVPRGITQRETAAGASPRRRNFLTCQFQER